MSGSSETTLRKGFCVVKFALRALVSGALGGAFTDPHTASLRHVSGPLEVDAPA